MGPLTAGGRPGGAAVAAAARDAGGGLTQRKRRVLRIEMSPILMTSYPHLSVDNLVLISK